MLVLFAAALLIETAFRVLPWVAWASLAVMIVLWLLWTWLKIWAVRKTETQ